MEPHGAIPILEIAARPMGFSVFISKTLIFKQNIWNVGFKWSFRWHIHLLHKVYVYVTYCDIQYKNPIGEFPVYEPNTCLDQWSFLVPLIGGRYHIIPQLAVYTTYIPLIYCLLGDYISPTTYSGNNRNSYCLDLQFSLPQTPHRNSARMSFARNFFTDHMQRCWK